MAARFRTGPVKRVTIWVRDIERSLALYRDILGLEVLEEKTIAGPYMAQMIGYEDGRLHIVHLAARGCDFGWIGLYALSGTTPAATALPAPGKDRLVPGQTAIVLESTDLEGIAARLEAEGYEFLLRPRFYVKDSDSPGMPAGRYGETIFYDPDGVPVSIMSYASGRPG
jgi:catechol 2,3-dioxygenase-like lactoylglutathione lyase family enzyme